MVVSWRVLLTAALALLSLTARAQQPGFVIRQVSVNLPDITAYVDVPPENGRAPQLGVSDLSTAALQGQNLKLEGVSITHGVAYTFLLDVSGSMRIRNDVLGAIGNWIDRLHPDDHLEMFAFGETYRQIGTPASDRATLKSDLTRLRSGEQTTNLFDALVRGIANAERTGTSLPPGRMIVLLTDGKDEGNGAVNESRVHEAIQTSHVPIFAIGHTRLGPEQDIYLGKMKSFAGESGGFYECAGTLPSTLCPPHASLEQAFERLSATMNRRFILQLKCDRCRPSDNHELQITLKNGATARIPVALTLLPEPPVPTPIPIWVYVAGALLLLAIALFVIWLAFRKKPEPQVPLEIPRAEVVVSPPQTGLPAHITIVSGPEPGRVYPFKLGEKAVIGKDAGCEVTLADDKEISGRHCELTRKGKRVEIADLGSTNGTFLNGAQVVARQLVEDGDLVRVGRTEFRVRFGDRG